ncbi:NAD-dependent epimerase/dehydratase family protein [Flavobacterium luteum]|uniref:NAD(P)-dependent oxidoreductase n=1 Tax=Flavobacterium luteum TaxID=2026654 RepID=A0A7J5AE82_9FLAO|nr:NAD(P)-dependent oxidoreductase [Flavobacterium luteum]KAB1155845.1 NAD(P)-dependent oxidoreductase [Flavobacterium luteum]
MKTAVVVGANGFLGSALVDKLLSQNHNVVAIYNSSFNKINKLATIYTKTQLFESEILPDYIYYLPGNYSLTHHEMLQLNDDLYQYSLKFANSKMVYISSTNVYGNSDEIITEDSVFNNPGLYALSKLSGEFIVSAMKHFSILRLTYVYGPGIANKSFIPQIIDAARNNKKITLFGKGERKQDYIYIDDAVSLCIACLQSHDNNRYLGATGISVSNKEIAEEIRKHTGSSIEFIGDETGKSFFFNPIKTFKELNWSPQTAISKGIKLMLS